jgi:hypothetical protein
MPVCTWPGTIVLARASLLAGFFLVERVLAFQGSPNMQSGFHDRNPTGTVRPSRVCVGVPLAPSRWSEQSSCASPSVASSCCAASTIGPLRQRSARACTWFSEGELSLPMHQCYACRCRPRAWAVWIGWAKTTVGFLSSAVQFCPTSPSKISVPGAGSHASWRRRTDTILWADGLDLMTYQTKPNHGNTFAFIIRYRFILFYLKKTFLAAV